MRDGDLSTMQDVERELLGIVEVRYIPSYFSRLKAETTQIGAIEAVLRYCAACSSQLEKLKLSPCGDEDEGIPSQSFSSTGTDIPIPDQDAGGEAPDLVSGELQPAILPDISLWTPVPDIPVLDQFVNESPERSTAEISSARTPEPPVAHDIPVQSLFGCRHCSKSFTSASNRRRHERSAHSGTVACRYCNKHIINRADNKRGHAKVCRVSPRNMF